MPHPCLFCMINPQMHMDEEIIKKCTLLLGLNCAFRSVRQFWVCSNEAYFQISQFCYSFFSHSFYDTNKKNHEYPGQVPWFSQFSELLLITHCAVNFDVSVN